METHTAGGWRGGESRGLVILTGQVLHTEGSDVIAGCI